MFDNQQTWIPDAAVVDTQRPMMAPQAMQSAGQGLADGLQSGVQLGKMMKPVAKKVEGGNPAADVGVTKNFVNSSGGVSQAQQSAMPVKDIATGAMQNPVTSSASKGLAGLAAQKAADKGAFSFMTSLISKG